MGAVFGSYKGSVLLKSFRALISEVPGWVSKTNGQLLPCFIAVKGNVISTSDFLSTFVFMMCLLKYHDILFRQLDEEVNSVFSAGLWWKWVERINPKFAACFPSTTLPVLRTWRIGIWGRISFCCNMVQSSTGNL